MNYDVDAMIDDASRLETTEAVDTLAGALMESGLDGEVAMTVALRLASAPTRAVTGRCLLPHASKSVASIQPIFEPTPGTPGVMYWRCTATEKHRTDVVATLMP